MDLRHVGSTAASIVAWLDQAQADALRDAVDARDGARVRAVLDRAGIDLPDGLDLDGPGWRGPFLRELDARFAIEDTSDDDTTTTVPDYARFATDLRSLDRLQELVDRLAAEEDVDLGAAFGWED